MMMVNEPPFLLGIKFKNTQNDIKLEQINANSLLDISNLLQSSSVKQDTYVDETIIYQEEHIVNEYDIYSRIEDHMNISLRLFQINKQGQGIVREIGIKKLKMSTNLTVTTKTKKMVNDSSLMTLFQCLSEVVNFNRTLTDKYTDLLSSLDDAMFSECDDIETFYVDESEYKLEAMYYKQETWIEQLEWHTQEPYTFHTSEKLDLGECSHILMFLNMYLDVLKTIEDQMKTHEKVLMRVQKLSAKITDMRNKMYDTLKNELS